MPATPNILLQNAAQAKAQAASAKTSAMAVDTGDKASSFAKVFADQGSSKPVTAADNSSKASRDKVADNSGKKDIGKDQSAAAQPVVADSGNDLPADKTAATDDTTPPYYQTTLAKPFTDRKSVV